MYQLCDHNDLFHWLEATKSCAINMFSYSFSNLDSQLVKAFIGCGFLSSLGPNGNIYSIGNNGCNPIPTKRGYDQFQLCRRFDMKIRLWTSAPSQTCPLHVFMPLQHFNDVFKVQC